jgi:hypothetical protein
MAMVKVGQVDEVEFIRADGSTFTAKLKVVGVVGGSQPAEPEPADNGGGDDGGEIQPPE